MTDIEINITCLNNSRFIMIDYNGFRKIDIEVDVEELYKLKEAVDASIELGIPTHAKLEAESDD